MRLVGLPIAIFQNENERSFNMNVALIAGDNKYQIKVVEKVAICTKDILDALRSQKFGDLVNKANDLHKMSDVRMVSLVGCQRGEFIPNNVFDQVENAVHQRDPNCTVEEAVFGVEADQTIETGTPSLEMTHVSLLKSLVDRSRAGVVDAYRYLTEELSILRRALPTQFKSNSNYDEANEYNAFMSQETPFDGYNRYTEDLISRARNGDSTAIQSLEEEARHTALQIFTDHFQNTKLMDGRSRFWLLTNREPRYQVPFTTESLRRIFGNELSRLLGIRGNICVKSIDEPRSPYYGDLVTVALADEEDKITGAQGDVVGIQNNKP